MKIHWGNISRQEFLDEYWEKKPILLKGAVPDFDDPMDENDLAGLAMEEVVESRIVSSVDSKWQVKHGPFSDYSELPEESWSLLVQGVDRWSEDVHELRSLIDFLPTWLIDDVMISYSTVNGGVGPHLDQYNVFILQGKGQRNWQVGAVNPDAKQFESADDLLQTDQFEPVIDEVLESGDLLYIPPFSPHSGVSKSPSMSYSLGLRAPSQSELLTSFADFIFEQELGQKRLTLPRLNISQLKTCDNKAAWSLESLKTFMLEIIDSENFSSFAHQFITEPTRELDIVPHEQGLSETQVFELVSDDNFVIKKVLGLQTSFYVTNQQIHFFCNGNLIKVPTSQINFVEHLHSNQTVETKVVVSPYSQLENLSLLTTLINTGFWYIEEA